MFNVDLKLEIGKFAVLNIDFDKPQPRIKGSLVLLLDMYDGVYGIRDGDEEDLVHEDFLDPFSWSTCQRLPF